MTQARSEFLRQIVGRGYLHQCTDLEGLDQRAAEGTVVAYIGFDCTADSLHVGSLVPIMMLRWLQRAGHKPIVLMGGGTSKIGDPSGKDESRQLLSDAEIARNMAGIKTVFAQFLRFGDGPSDALMIDNADWLGELNYVAFLRDFGRHFSVNRMLGFDSVKLRLEREQPLSFLEFNYMVLQAYDFMELERRYDCVLQMGGSDQWGNIVGGVELIRRVDQKTAYGLTSPLITTGSGAKMGKTAAGAVWLNEARLSAYDYWQYWRNVEDGDVGRFLRLFTELPEDEIRRLDSLEGAEINEAKKILANEATRLCRGDEAVEIAQASAKSVFEQGQSGLISSGSEESGGDQTTGLPIVEVSRERLEAGVPLYELLRESGLTRSNGEARRLIKGGGGRVNNVVVREEQRSVTLADLTDEGVIKLSAGRKRHALVKSI